MKRQLWVGICFGILANVSADAADVILNISEAQSDDGSIVASLWNSEDAYLDLDARIMRVSAEIEAGESIITLTGLKPGTYSIALYHDENSNDEMDTNFIGIPKEGWAFSNNAKGKFGPPSFEKTSFMVSTDTVQMDISMNY